MSIFSDILHDVASLLLPRVCPICGAELNDRHSTVCTMCELTAPLTEMWNDVENPLTQYFFGMSRVVRGEGPFIVSNIAGRGVWLTGWGVGMADTSGRADYMMILT